MHYNTLIHKFLTGVINAEESRELNQWLAKDPVNKQEFEEIKLIWESAEDEENEVPDAHFQQELQKLENSIAESRERELLMERQKTRNRFKNLVIAGLLLITAALFASQYAREVPATTTMASNNMNQEIILADNSRVLLNDNSAVSFTMASDRRQLDIVGEALFEVSRDTKPFVINTSDVTITVLGTSFIVKAYKDKPVEVVVISGAVEVQYRDSVLALHRGERALMQNNRITKSFNQDPNFNAWYTRKLEFDKTELEEVLSLLETQYDARFYVADLEILRCRFTGKFNNSDLQHIIEVLSFSLDIEFASRVGNNYQVSGRGCAQ